MRLQCTTISRPIPRVVTSARLPASAVVSASPAQLSCRTANAAASTRGHIGPPSGASASDDDLACSALKVETGKGTDAWSQAQLSLSDGHSQFQQCGLTFCGGLLHCLPPGRPVQICSAS